MLPFPVYAGEDRSIQDRPISRRSMAPLPQVPPFSNHLGGRIWLVGCVWMPRLPLCHCFQILLACLNPPPHHATSNPKLISGDEFH